MTFWQAAILAAIAVIGAIGTVWVSTRDLRLRRRMETGDRFLTIAATAQARGREDAIGTSEQVSAIHLLGELGASERELTAAAHASLLETIRWSGPDADGPQEPSSDDVIAAMRKAGVEEDRIDEASIATVKAGIVAPQRRQSPALREVHRNAKLALARVESSRRYRSLKRRDARRQKVGAADAIER